MSYLRWSFLAAPHETYVFSLAHPANAGGDCDAHEQHSADSHTSDNGRHGTIGLEHVIV